MQTDAAIPISSVSVAIHASAVAINGRALIIRGASKAGKSHLALALIASSTTDQSIILLGDDRILLTPSGKGLTATPHPRIAGFIERRGLGIVAVPYAAAASVAAIVNLGETIHSNGGHSTLYPGSAHNFPTLSIVGPICHEARRDLALRWFSRLCATNEPHM